MKRLIVILAAIAIGGCAAKSDPLPSISAAGNGVAKIVALTDGAERANQSIKPHADAVGKALSDQVSLAHGAIGTEASKVNVDLADAQTQVQSLTTDKASAIAANQRIKSSGAYRLGMFLFFVGWLLITLCAVHLVCLLLALILPPPWSIYAGIVGRICNPFAWPAWFIGNIERNRAVKEVVTDIAAYNQPTTPYTPSTARIVTAAVGTAAAAPLYRS